MGGSQYASVTQRSEYARLSLERLLNISWVQNMPRFWIWQGSEYEKVTHGSKFVTTRPNMSKFTIIDKAPNMPQKITLREVTLQVN